MSTYLSSEQRKSYEIVRAEAQARANETGRDFGVEFNPLYKEWSFMGLPNPENRYGCELRCEVVRPEKWGTL